MDRASSQFLSLISIKQELNHFIQQQYIVIPFRLRHVWLLVIGEFQNESHLALNFANTPPMLTVLQCSRCGGGNNGPFSENEMSHRRRRSLWQIFENALLS